MNESQVQKILELQKSANERANEASATAIKPSLWPRQSAKNLVALKSKLALDDERNNYYMSRLSSTSIISAAKLSPSELSKLSK